MDTDGLVYTAEKLLDVVDDLVKVLTSVSAGRKEEMEQRGGVKKSMPLSVKVDRIQEATAILTQISTGNLDVPIEREKEGEERAQLLMELESADRRIKELIDTCRGALLVSSLTTPIPSYNSF